MATIHFILFVVEEKKNSHRFGIAWGLEIDDSIFILGWTLANGTLL